MHLRTFKFALTLQIELFPFAGFGDTIYVGALPEVRPHIFIIVTIQDFSPPAAAHPLPTPGELL